METIIQKALKLLLDKYGAEYDCVGVTEENGHYRGVIETEDTSRLIGKGGSVINELQMLLKNILWNQTGEKVFITLDVGGYRQEQDEKIYAKAKKYITWMEEQNLSEIKMHPMRPYYRRMIHLWIANEYPNLTTDSVGEGKERAVKIRHK